MEEKLYKIVFSGAVATGKSTQEVKQSLAQLMAADLAQVETLFSGRAIVIKKNLSFEVALRYADAFNEAGAIAEVKPHDDEDMGMPAAAEYASSTVAATHAASLSSAVATNINPASPSTAHSEPLASVEPEEDEVYGNPLVNAIVFILKLVFTLLFSGIIMAVIAGLIFWLIAGFDFAGIDIEQLLQSITG